jgi:CTP:molybdopterin cytidylyltransferase MocA
MPQPGPIRDRVAGVVLAAGASTRFGSPKQLARVGEGTMLEAAIDVARRAGLRPILAVVPPGLAVPPDVVPVVNADPAAGLSRSLQLGIGAVPPEASAAVILLGDQPSLDPAVIRRLLGARDGAGFVAAVDPTGVVAPPVLIERAGFETVVNIAGDEGLRHLLRDGGVEVLRVQVATHPPDIDAQDDLAAVERCPGCGGIFTARPDITEHPYIGASSGCWATFNEVLARGYSDPTYGRVHRHTVDVYAVQHPGRDHRRERQSVALHLIGLCHWLEHAKSDDRLNSITQRLASEKRDWPWLTPPSGYRMDVRDLVAAEDGAEHVRLVRAWAKSVWEAWSAHHELVRQWASEALVGG